jgi:AAA+ ATPase superfamily predicted ATPase
MVFIDRAGELERLDALIARPEGGLALLWGRRRIGKTRLLLEWSSQHQGLYTVADESASSVQRSYFARAVADRFPGFDEFPYLAAASPAFASIFQNWLDREARNTSLVVAVAGSSQRMMQGLVLEAAAPLYGRVVELIELRPLLPGYIADAFGAMGPRRSIELYALWGGIPRYWELSQPLGGDLERP